jgi:hypothetical protein
MQCFIKPEMGLLRRTCTGEEVVQDVEIALSRRDIRDPTAF